MISDVLRDAASEIRRYLADFEDVYNGTARHEVHTVLLTMDALRRKFDDPTYRFPETNCTGHTLVVVVPYEKGRFSDKELDDAITNCEIDIIEAIGRAGVGYCDGFSHDDDHIGFVLRGPDDDALYAAVEPILEANPFTLRGGAVSYGPGRMTRVHGWQFIPDQPVNCRRQPTE